MYDFAVVGIGPAGARFARRAAQNGHSVIAFEKGEIGTPLACSGHVSMDIWDYVPESAKDSLFQNDIYGARFHPNGVNSSGYLFYRDDVISNAIDRISLDKILAEKAADAGAEIRSHHTVTNIQELDNEVKLQVRHKSETKTFRAKMVAGCDGPRSRARDALGLPDPQEFLHGVLGFAEEPDHQDYVDVHLTVPTFFAWRIPRGDAGVEYGLAMPPGNDVADRFSSFLDGYNATIGERCSGLIPIGPPSQITSSRGFLIGDAAGQTKPFTGGGILYGMTAADYAANTIDPDTPQTIREYESTWRSDFTSEIFLGRLIRKGYSAPPLVQQLGLRLFSGKIGVHMDKPTSLFSTEQLRALLSR
ncbi:MAG: geranylgeranyl reductase family protein [Halobacteriaceae archaeon]